MLTNDLANKICAMHDEAIIVWHAKNNFMQDDLDELFKLILHNHECNFNLWYQEDLARRDDRGYQFVYAAKRAIDKYNQMRNNFIEQIDLLLLNSLNISTDKTCPVHSETPAMIIDKLSILSLKIYNMRLQTQRIDVDQQHLTTCNEKLNILLAQRQQLSQCLQIFLTEIIDHRRTFKLYHQFKMCNDPTLNPQLYNPND